MLQSQLPVSIRTPGFDPRLFAYSSITAFSSPFEPSPQVDTQATRGVPEASTDGEEPPRSPESLYLALPRAFTSSLALFLLFYTFAISD